MSKRQRASLHDTQQQSAPAHSNHPSKHLVRAWLSRRLQDLKPPPAPEEIRRQLGWSLLLLEPAALLQAKVGNGTPG